MANESTSKSDEIREAIAGSAFHTWMGMRVVDVTDGEVVLALETSTHHLNLQSLVHGGVIATLADTAAGLAMRSVIDTGNRHVTINLDVQYLRAARGGTLTACGVVVRKGRSVGFADAEVTDERGLTLARAQVTMALSGPGDGRREVD
jgi:uncharacterized protein (TIGR00369 family)